MWKNVKVNQPLKKCWFGLHWNFKSFSSQLFLKLNLTLSLHWGIVIIWKPKVVFQCFLSKQGTNLSQEDDTFIHPYLPYFVSFVYFYWTIVLRNKYQAFATATEKLLFSKTRQTFSPVIRPSGESSSFTPFHPRILLRNHGQNQRHKHKHKTWENAEFIIDLHLHSWMTNQTKGIYTSFPIVCFLSSS